MNSPAKLSLLGCFCLGQSHLDNHHAKTSILNHVEGCESGKTAHFNAVQ
jgi:hypothetical protein